jgi:hypothetical protein
VKTTEEQLSYTFTGVALGFSAAYFIRQIAAKNHFVPALERGKRDLWVLPLIGGAIFGLSIHKSAPNISKGVFLGAAMLSALSYLKCREEAKRQIL